MSVITETRERPILFSSPMIRAILREVERPGTGKTQTRRPVKPPAWWEGMTHHATGNVDGRGLTRTNMVLTEKTATHWKYCPFGAPGDVLYVRETAYIAPPNFCDPAVATHRDGDGRPRVVGYAASMDGEAVRCATDYGVRPTPSISMPRWASRLRLTITEVRVQRLRQISEADAIAEGFRAGTTNGLNHLSAREQFSIAWDHINARRSDWFSDPWVWVISFKPELIRPEARR